MQNSTLFLLQTELKSAASLLQQLDQISTPTDPVVLMAESALLLEHSSLKTHPVYILKTEAELFGLDPNSEVKIIDYAEFTDLILQYSRCISLK